MARWSRRISFSIFIAMAVGLPWKMTGIKHAGKFITGLIDEKLGADMFEFSSVSGVQDTKFARCDHH